MGAALRYLVAGLTLSGVWLLIALNAVPGALREVDDFALFGWPALGLLFLGPLALIWCFLWLVRLQRRVTRLQALVAGQGGAAEAPRRRQGRAGGLEEPRLETPAAKGRGEGDTAPSPEPFERYEARVRRELAAIAMDLASIVSAPSDYERALAQFDGGAEDAFFRLLARDLQPAGQAGLHERLAGSGGGPLVDSYLETYEQLLVAAYRSDPGGQSVKRLVDSPIGRLHQAIESCRRGDPRGAAGG